jgi:hypothetical protein
MSRPALALSRLATLAPPAKIGRLMRGAKLQAPLPLSNRLLRLLLATPVEAVRLMLGKKAARAAPILALAPASWCSAASTSGRRVSTSDGRPAGRSRRIWAVTRPPAGSRSAGTSAPTTSRRAFLSCSTWAMKGGDVAAGGSARVWAWRPPAGDRPGVEPALDQLQRVLRVAQGLLGQGQQVLVGGQGQPGAGRLGDQADLDRAAGLAGWPDSSAGPRCLRLRTGRTGRSPRTATPTIGRIDLDCRSPPAGSGPRSFRPASRGRGVDRRHRAARWIRYWARDLLDVEHGHAQVAVVGQRQVDHALQARGR